MHTGLDDDHELLRDGLRAVLAAEDSVGIARDLAEGRPQRRDLWAALAATGVAGLLIDEAYGGLALGDHELVVTAEELGRALGATPFVSTSVLAATLLASVPGGEDLLPGIVTGASRVAVVEPGRGGIGAEYSDGAWVLDGTVHDVIDVVAADRLLVLAGLEGEIPGLLVVDPSAEGVARAAQPTLDATQPWGTITFERVAVGNQAVLATQLGVTLAQARRRRVLAASADAVGVGAAAVALGVAEAKTHEQFGRPIGAFQGVAHPLVEAYAAVERARSLTYAAAAACAAGRPDAEQLVVLARVLAVPAARLAAETAIQVHGALGYTWDHDLHLYYRRARAAEHLTGPTSSFEERGFSRTIR